MIMVTGTKRSGTSMWMQILINAGFSFLGKDYIGVWKESIQQANPKGFFESKLRNGINYTNNPNPENGVYLHPKPTNKYAVKVFVPGLIKTDFAFVHRVVGTIRPWNEYCASIERLLRLEDEYYLRQPEVEGELPIAAKNILRSPIEHPALLWWRDNFDLVFDALVRKYPVNIVAYDRLLEAPEEVIPTVVEWCNSKLTSDLFPHRALSELNIERAVLTVDRTLRTQRGSSSNTGDLPQEILSCFEDLYACFHTGHSRLTKEFCAHLNQVHQQIQPLRDQWKKQRLLEKRDALREVGLSEEEIKKGLFSNVQNRALLS